MDASNARSAAITSLNRSTSIRQLTRQPSEREAALARLEGTTSPQNAIQNDNSLLRKPSATGAPRLSALQRRHLEKQRQQEQTESEDHPQPDSPDFSIFTPSVVGGTSQVEQATRQEARSNLMRKLSQRDGNSSAASSPVLTQQPISDARSLGRQTLKSQDDSQEVIAASPTISEMTASDFKPYRYTMERDRDSAYARFNDEDQFEYAELLRSGSVRSVASTIASGRRPSADAGRRPSADAGAHNVPVSYKTHNLHTLRDSETLPEKTPKTRSHTITPEHTPKSKFELPDPSYQFPSPIKSTSHEQSQALARSKSHEPHASTVPRHIQDTLTSSGAAMRRIVSADDSHQPFRTATSTPKTHHKSSSSSQSHSRKVSREGRQSPFANGDLESTPRQQSRRDILTPSPASSSRSRHSASHKHTKHPSLPKSPPLVLRDSTDFVRPNGQPFRDEADDNSDFDDYIIAPQIRKVSLESPGKPIVGQHLSALLAQANLDDPPKNFDDTPRQLIMHAPVLQVVNAHTVKDRYLFLFSDVLLIAKPLVEEDPASGLVIPPSIDSRFLVKSIVELEKLKLTAQRDDDAQAAEEAMQKRKHSLLQNFVDRFANNPKKAIDTLVTKGGLANEPPVIANLLFRTAELNRSQLGSYLCKRENKNILKAYVDRFRFTSIRIEDALRIFLATIRLPNDAMAAEYLLSTFASVYLYANQSLGIDQTLCSKLVIAIMELNDYLHSGLDDDSSTSLGSLFGFPNPAITVDDFLSAFRERDTRHQVSDDALTRTYLSIRKERLQQAADNSIIAVTPDIPIVMDPARLPSRLTYRQQSETITITLPKPDPKFQIRLLGGDLICEPNVLSFSKSASQSFTITGTVLGPKSLLFLKMGPTCTFYSGLPINKTFSVERAFMRHTFQLAFVNHLGVKRKYMFSMSDGDMRSSWVDQLVHRVQERTDEAASATDSTSKIAHSVALQVLRDAVLAPEDANVNSAQRPGSRGATPNSIKQPSHVRSNSFSKTYAFGSGRAESDLAPTPAAHSHLLRPAMAERSMSQSRFKDSAAEKAMEPFAKTGHEVVLASCQNSHIPLLLGFLNHHVNGVPHPLSKEGQNFRRLSDESTKALVDV